MVQYDNQRIHKDEQQQQTSFTYSSETSLLLKRDPQLYHLNITIKHN